MIVWLCSLAGTIKVKSLKLYLKGIKSYQLDLGINSTPILDPRLERTFQGIKRDLSEPTRRERTPLSWPYLLRLLHHLHSLTYHICVLRVTFHLAFASFLPVGEFTYRETDRQLGALFGKWYKKKRSLKVSDNATHIELILPVPKRDPFGKWITLTIAST